MPTVTSCIRFYDSEAGVGEWRVHVGGGSESGLRMGHNYGVRKRVLEQVLTGTSDTNVRFEELRSLLVALGFAERIRGDHHIFSEDRRSRDTEFAAAEFVREAIPGKAGSRCHRSV